MFMHGGWLHIGGNMLFLFIFGDNIEKAYGHIKYLTFYLVCGIIAGLAHVLSQPDSIIPSLGASGAISGVMAAYLVLFPTNRVRVLLALGFVLLRPIMVPAVVMIGVWALLQFVNGIGSIAVTDQTSGVAYWAHIGGFIAGVVITFLAKPFLHRASRRGSQLEDRGEALHVLGDGALTVEPVGGAEQVAFLPRGVAAAELAVDLDQQTLGFAVFESGADEIEQHVGRRLHLVERHEPARRIERDLVRAGVAGRDEDGRAHVSRGRVVRRVSGGDVAGELGLELGHRPRCEQGGLVLHRGGLGLWRRRGADTGTREEVRGVREIRVLGMRDRFGVLQHHR